MLKKEAIFDYSIVFSIFIAFFFSILYNESCIKQKERIYEK
ncbi:hypothetical protein HMPREF1863_00288 [Aedoeadaptatus coxii]|uniref:Uncharacterized protein n=1 Tax=Aedoeadaptatus coxii TaxID=755172 RepID=A0A134AKK6_9FIRM|nr:hypothetical protein HMPREF1863_00288 [Peptoniphilus coxii]